LKRLNVHYTDGVKLHELHAVFSTHKGKIYSEKYMHIYNLTEFSGVLSALV